MKKLYKLKSIALFFCLVMTSCLKDEPLKLPYNGFRPYKIKDSWSLSTPSKEKIDSIKLDEVFRYIYSENEFLLVRSMIIVRNGKIVAEAYPSDPYDIFRIQNIKSDTKSFTGILAGIALQQGLLDSVNQKLSDIYPESFVNHQDKKSITIADALTMRTGFVSDNKNTGYDWYFSENTIEFALSSTWNSIPGTEFSYTDINPQFVSYAIQKRYGKPMSEFARVTLFDTLGIDNWIWEAGKDGITFGASNLYLKPRDMAKFGQLLLQNGKWENKQIVDSAWVSESIKPHVSFNGEWAYGYYMWINPLYNSYFAAGHGGQTIFIAPGKNLVVVVTAWPYVQDNPQWKDNFEFSLYKKVLEACN